ncbi:MAG: type VI secretion system contractile sheath small subunit [Phycisphaerales bacterium]
MARNENPTERVMVNVLGPDGETQTELPWHLALIDDFGFTTGTNPATGNWEWTKVNRDNFDDLIRSKSPKVRLKIRNTLLPGSPEQTLEITIRSMRDFEPANLAELLAEQIPELRALLRDRQKIVDLLALSGGNTANFVEAVEVETRA